MFPWPQYTTKPVISSNIRTHWFPFMHEMHKQTYLESLPVVKLEDIDFSLELVF